MEIKEEQVDYPVKEADEASVDPKLDEYPSSGESTMTCSTLSSLVSLPTLESLSDSAPDAKSNQSSIKRNRRGRRGRKPKQLPKTSRSDDDLLIEEGAMESVMDPGKRMKILLPQKVSTDMMNQNPNISNLGSSYSENRLVDVCETINALPNLNISKAKKKRGNRGKSAKKNVMTADESENPAKENDSDQFEFDKNHQFQLLNKDSDSGLSGKTSPSIEYSVEAEIAFEKQVSELCKDIKKTNLGNINREGNVSTMPSSSKATTMDVRMPVNLNDIASGSARYSNLLDGAGPSTSHGSYEADSASGPSMRGKIALAERRKKIFRKRRDTIVPKGFDATVKKRIMKLTDEIDQIDAILAKEIDKKDEYQQRGYKITHQILSNLKKEKEG